MWGKIKAVSGDERTFTAILLVTVALAAFGLGRLSLDHRPAPVREVGAVSIQKSPTRTSTEVEAQTSADSKDSNDVAEDGQGGYVGSKNGTKYHLPSCPGAKQITKENLVRFETKEEAEAAGYSKASNCPGL